jgi:hypothetical protein
VTVSNDYREDLKREYASDLRLRFGDLNDFIRVKLFTSIESALTKAIDMLCQDLFLVRLASLSAN